jgi:hypothetical protein
MTPPALSRLVPELSHVSVDHFVARPGEYPNVSIPYPIKTPKQKCRRCHWETHDCAHVATRLAPTCSPHVHVEASCVRAGVSLFFLTHMHTDHLQGLRDDWCAGTLFCSPLSRRMLLYRYRINATRVIALDTDVAHHIGEGTLMSFTARLIDANHCPGAVMVLLQGSFGNLLHTGDFRLFSKNPES